MKAIIKYKIEFKNGDKAYTKNYKIAQSYSLMGNKVTGKIIKIIGKE